MAMDEGRNQMGQAQQDQESAALLRSLMRELWQAERSAQRHARLEAERNGAGTPPARALEAVARHADAVLEELPRRVEHHHLGVSAAAATAVGSAFSLWRSVTDLLLTRERSYRATLLGLRHGLDVVQELAAAARAAGDEDLAAWSERALQARAPLVDGVAQNLAWFAAHPAVARTPVEAGALGRGAWAVQAALQRLQQTLRQRRLASKAA